MNTQQMMEDYDRLARLCEAKDVEIAKLKAIPMKYRRMEFNAQLQKELSKAQAQIAMQAEALRPFANFACDCGECFNCKALKALSATSETVAAWIAKETEPLRREVGELYEALRQFVEEFISPDTGEISRRLIIADGVASLKGAQATALAYEREVENRGAVKARETAIHEYLIDQMNRDYSTWPNQAVAKFMPEFFHRLHAEFWDSISAANKGEAK